MERAEFAEQQATLPAPRLVFVDEFAINVAMTRTHARALRGARAHATEPVNYGQSISVIAALSLRGVFAPMTIEGAVNGEVFDAYVEHVLVPGLRRDDIVFLDNVKFHYSERAVNLIQAAGASVEYLPAYSPDFDPIEECISKIKAMLRKLKARTKRTLANALRRAIEMVTLDDICGWFRHCGYTYSLK